MAEPKQKLSRSRTRRRRGSKKYQAKNFIKCPKCQSPVLPHHVCDVCGTYKGREVIETKSKITTKIKDKKKK